MACVGSAEYNILVTTKMPQRSHSKCVVTIFYLPHFVYILQKYMFIRFFSFATWLWPNG